MQRLNYFRTSIILVSLLFVGVLSSCRGDLKPPVEEPNNPESVAYGVWEDTEAILSTCGNSEQMSVLFSLASPGAYIAIQSTGFETAYGYGAFSKPENSKQVSGIIGQSTWSFSFDLTLENNTLSGKLVDSSSVACEDGSISETSVSVHFTPSEQDLDIPAAEQDEFEPNDVSEKAKTIELGSVVEATLTDEDWFTFTLSEQSVVNFTFDANNARFGSVFAELFNNQLELADQYYSKDDWFGGASSYKLLPAGTYFIALSGDISSSTHAYTLNISANPLPDASIEPNDTVESATNIALNTNAKDMYLTKADEDWLTFELDNAQLVTFKLDMKGSKYSDFNHVLTAEEVASYIYHHTEGGSFVYALDEGIYHLKVSNFGDEKPYSIELKTQPIPDSIYEPNDSLDEAYLINLPFSGTIYLPQEDEDWLELNLEEDQTVTFSVKGIDAASSLNSSRHVHVIERIAPHYYRDGNYVTTLKKGQHFFKFSDSQDDGRAYSLKIEGKPSADSSSF